MKKHNPNVSRGHLILFRTVCILIALILLISAIAFSHNHLHMAGLVCLLFAFVVLPMIFVQKTPGFGWWLSLFGVVLLVLIILGFVAV
jgi:hypothetical protein